MSAPANFTRVRKVDVNVSVAAASGTTSVAQS
jgi:hypothetical protein